jgi:hypothetical protein
VALKRLKKMCCDVVPTCSVFKRKCNGPVVPGGFITFVVWENAPREPLDYQEFWNMNDYMRESIRKICP